MSTNQTGRQITIRKGDIASLEALVKRKVISQQMALAIQLRLAEEDQTITTIHVPASEHIDID